MAMQINQKGVSTIIIVVILSTVFVLMGFVFAFRGIARLEEAEIALDGDRAEWAAESGVDEALLQMRRDPVSYSGSTITIEQGVTAVITVDNGCLVPPAICVINAQGRSGDSIKTLEVRLENDTTYEGFHPKIISKRFI